MITRALIAINVLAFFWEISVAGPGMIAGLGGGGNMYQVLQDGSLYPAAVLVNHEWWRIFTSAFLHAGLLHIGVNMFSLWVLGRFIEAGLGPARMLLVYVVSLIAAGLGIVYLSPASSALVPTLGASGAIFGLFGALFAIGFKLGPRGMALVRQNSGILVLNLIITFTVPQISWQAHVGGLIVGFILTYAIFFPPKPVRAVVLDPTTGQRFESEVQSPGEHRRSLP